MVPDLQDIPDMAPSAVFGHTYSTKTSGPSPPLFLSVSLPLHFLPYGKEGTMRLYLKTSFIALPFPQPDTKAR
jgi:hypothetical protein